MKRDLLTDEPIEDERYELQAGPCYDFSPSRREFVEALGADFPTAWDIHNSKPASASSPRDGQHISMSVVVPPTSAALLPVS